MRRALGIDVASANWSANGAALVEIDKASGTFTRVDSGVLGWPTDQLTPARLAEVIDAYARAKGVAAVGLDGPQGFRDPATIPGTPGVGRRCEHACNTQGKTGVYPVTYPGNQRGWIEFCVKLFDELLAKQDVVLANDAAPTQPDRGYLLLEVFPTSTWRKSGLTPLPGKSARPVLGPFATALSSAFGLPAVTPATHDDLQAIVAALPAAMLLGARGVAVPSGVPATTGMDADGVNRRREGYIWDATPPQPFQAPHAGRVSRSASRASRTTVRVTQGVLDDVNRNGPKRAMISVRGVEGATNAASRKLTLTIDDDDYSLVLGDTYAFHRVHQDESTRPAFEALFAMLAERPDQNLEVAGVVDERAG